jgi:hypothetical protein
MTSLQQRERKRNFPGVFGDVNSNVNMKITKVTDVFAVLLLCVRFFLNEHVLSRKTNEDFAELFPALRDKRSVNVIKKDSKWDDNNRLLSLFCVGDIN